MFRGHLARMAVLVPLVFFGLWLGQAFRLPWSRRWPPAVEMSADEVIGFSGLGQEVRELLVANGFDSLGKLHSAWDGDLEGARSLLLILDTKARARPNFVVMLREMVAWHRSQALSMQLLIKRKAAAGLDCWQVGSKPRVVGTAVTLQEASSRPLGVHVVPLWRSRFRRHWHAAETEQERARLEELEHARWSAALLVIVKEGRLPVLDSLLQTS